MANVRVISSKNRHFICNVPMHHCILLLLVLLETFPWVAGIKWLALSDVASPWNETRHCPNSKQDRKRYGLTGQQVKLCRRLPALMPAIIDATKATKNVCQSQFQDRRWNCSTVNMVPRLSPDLAKGTREQAYVYALSSAAIAVAVAKGCTTGQVFFCPCGSLPTTAPDPDANFKWQGCSDNVAYGVKVSKQFADSPFMRPNKRKNRMLENSEETPFITFNEIGNSKKNWNPELNELRDNPKARMNKHNNDVGRFIVEQSIVSKCKCHGISGSCQFRTCWSELLPLANIGAKLTDKYVRATEVQATDSSHLQLVEFQPVALMGRVTQEDLVYIRKSPDYCMEDGRVGSFGTRGRTCNITSKGHDGCDSMCCGRGHASEKTEVIENCNCKYVHCCYVECKKCSYIVDRSYCK